MRDITNLELRRGDRVIDSEGTFYWVMAVTPATLHLQNTVTGKRFNTGRQTLLKVPPGDMKDGKLFTTKERKRYYFDLTTGPRRRMRG